MPGNGWWEVKWRRRKEEETEKEVEEGEKKGDGAQSSTKRRYADAVRMATKEGSQRIAAKSNERRRRVKRRWLFLSFLSQLSLCVVEKAKRGRVSSRRTDECTGSSD